MNINGDIVQWDARTHQKIKIVSYHTKTISDLQHNADRTLFISASKDNCAKLCDTETLENLKTYKTNRPVNSASISPKFDHVVLGGGQEAMDVTTTSTKIGKFDARFFHMVNIRLISRIEAREGVIVECPQNGLFTTS